MFARAHTFTIEGLHTRHVTVEVDVRPGLPGFAIVGLADAAVREARERIQAALHNCGYRFPASRITANLAPSDVRKAGAGLDLPLACALLAASGQLPGEQLEGVALFGELALDGSVRGSHGALAVAEATRRAGLRKLALAGAGAREAHLVEGLEVAAVERLQSAVRVLAGGAGDPLPACPRPGCQTGEGEEPSGLDLMDVRGQHHAVWTMVVAAAGAHNALLVGPPGTGKTMLAQRLPSILPPLSAGEAMEVTRIHTLAGTRVQALAARRPFRAPHHSITAAGLVGGAHAGRVGEVVLAHNGVLFLDELSEFARASLEALRQPLEDGRVAIARARHAAVYPARFMLIAATNPCPCGYADGSSPHGIVPAAGRGPREGDGERCRCSEAELARHRRRLSGPLLDRIDLLASLAREPAGEPRAGALVSSTRAREEVALARERQARRLREDGVRVNGHMDARMLARHVRLDARAQELLSAGRQRGLLSARGEHRVLRVARTLADLRGGERVRACDVGAALALRADAAVAGNRAA